MPKRTRSSGGSEDPVPDPPSKRTRSASKSPGTAPPKQPKKPQKPKGSKKEASTDYIGGKTRALAQQTTR